MLPLGTQTVMNGTQTGGRGMRRLGFTTIELIIVIVMIGVLASIGFPKIRGALDKTNARSGLVSIATSASTARALATQRGCRAVVHFAGGSNSQAWVTACPRYAPGAGTVDTVAMIDDVSGRFNVTMTYSRDSVQYDPRGDRKSTRLNSSHSQISYAVFCLKKKKGFHNTPNRHPTRALRRV